MKESQLQLTLADRWILSRFANASKDVTRNLKTYRFAEAAQAIYHFAWNEYCDWYLEMAKPRWALADKGEAMTAEERADLRTARWVSWKVLDGILRLLHPFMPLRDRGAVAGDPARRRDAGAGRRGRKSKKAWVDAGVEREVSFLQEVVVAVRNLRAEQKIAPGRAVPVVVRGSDAQLDLLERLQGQLMPLARIETLTLSRDGARPPVAASAVVQGAEVFLPLAGPRRSRRGARAAGARGGETARPISTA